MATAADVKRLAMALEGTTSAAHFDRTAFKVKRIYATAGEGTLNLNFLPEEQEFKVMMAPEVFNPISNAWGRNGWTAVDLSKIGLAELESALRMAWEHGRSTRPKGRR
jgi:hypothetical protein